MELEELVKLQEKRFLILRAEINHLKRRLYNHEFPDKRLPLYDEDGKGMEWKNKPLLRYGKD